MPPESSEPAEAAESGDSRGAFSSMKAPFVAFLFSSLLGGLVSSGLEQFLWRNHYAVESRDRACATRIALATEIARSFGEEAYWGEDIVYSRAERAPAAIMSTSQTAYKNAQRNDRQFEYWWGAQIQAQFGAPARARYDTAVKSLYDLEPFVEGDSARLPDEWAVEDRIRELDNGLADAWREQCAESKY
jgi:hypothetical protein